MNICEMCHGRKYTCFPVHIRGSGRWTAVAAEDFIAASKGHRAVRSSRRMDVSDRQALHTRKMRVKYRQFS